LSVSRLDDQHKVVIGIGSNINPKENLLRAVESLSKLTEILVLSKVYRTQPIGGAGPNFLNAAALVTTKLSMTELKVDVLRQIESKLGRVRSSDPNSPRTIDLDILIFDGIVIDQNIWHIAHLCVPTSELLPLFPDESQDHELKNNADNFLRSSQIDPVLLDLHWRGSS
jgi:2-amino-4-hydroxy-6-hydroxymethyldihydropteridine diphosphokinase